ncbi:hypothetical protein EDB89DRAFT_1900217 [Lactarius sanguifluus]|nr:hypothetical protein EDB89DRAFT_1900217 [Lactarius sanguifluus]
MAVADAVAALAGCWRRLVVFVQLEAVSADLRHVVVESRVVVGCFPQATVASHATLNVQDYDNHKPRQRTVPNTTRTAVPTTTTTQRAAAATTTTHRRRFIVHPQQQRQQTSMASDDTSSNDDYDDAIDGDSGAAITRRATAVTRMRWRGVLASASTRGSDGYSRREYECQLGKLGKYESSTKGITGAVLSIELLTKTFGLLSHMYGVIPLLHLRSRCVDAPDLPTMILEKPGIKKGSNSKPDLKSGQIKKQGPPKTMGFEESFLLVKTFCVAPLLCNLNVFNNILSWPTVLV